MESGVTINMRDGEVISGSIDGITVDGKRAVDAMAKLAGSLLTSGSAIAVRIDPEPRDFAGELREALRESNALLLTAGKIFSRDSVHGTLSKEIGRQREKNRQLLGG